jgi:hypothetical protein
MGISSTVSICTKLTTFPSRKIQAKMLFKTSLIGHFSQAMPLAPIPRERTKSEGEGERLANK